MTEQIRKNTATDDEDSGLLSQLPVDRLRDEALGFSRAFGKRSLDRLGSGVEGITERLTGFVDGIPMKNDAKQSKGDSPVKAGAKAAVDKVAAPVGKVKDTAAAQVKGTAAQVKDTAAQVKDTVGQVAGGLGKSGQPTGKKVKVTNIVEAIDVPVSRDVAYEQWTQFEDFPSFMKKVENVTQEENEVVTWQARVFWSHRTWKATILDQVLNEHIVWKSQSEKGRVDGAVTFHELAPNLTRILVSLEYHPKGLFEHTGNLWRAQGRRVRLEMKHFRRHVANHTLLHSEEIEGWAGEIHDKRVVENGTGDGAKNGRKDGQKNSEKNSEKNRQEKGRKATARTSSRSRSSEKSSGSESSKGAASGNETAAKKTAAKKTTAKKTTAKKTAAKKAPAKTAAKKTAAKKAPAKKTAAKRTTSKQSATKRSPRKQSASRRTSSSSASQGA
jgi:uncharacterized membrane protein